MIWAVATRRRLAAALVVASACTDSVASLGDLVPDTGDDGAVEEPFVLGTSAPRGVDVLVVVDNTPGMAPAQAALGLALGAQIEALAATNDVRVSFTTTDNGNPACVGTTPELGALSLSSCRTRLDEFVSLDPTVDVAAVGCLEVCDLEGFGVLPTVDVPGAEPVIRPWIESVAGVSNVQAELGLAVACATPQGTAGCALEQPLEAMRNALLRSLQTGSAAEGFVRPDAALAIVILTAASDCSYDPARQEAFVAGGNRVFWSDPRDLAPTAAACWNAGVACSGGDMSVWGECLATDKGVDGEPSAGADAVLFPLSRYAELLAELAELKTPYLADVPVGLYVIAGVPAAYEAGVTPLSFPKGGDPTYLSQFGVGPACGVDASRAVPAVRLREFGENYGDVVEGRVASICDLAYDGALVGLGAAGQPSLAPLCYPECAADMLGDAGGLQPACTVSLEFGTAQGRTTAAVPACGGIPVAPEIPDGSDVCWYARIDRVGSTLEVADDVDPACIETGANLQIQIVRAGGTLEPGGTSVLARCTADPACP